MKTSILELRQKRAKLIADGRALLERAETEKRDLTSEEQSNWDKVMDDADKLRGQAERMERQLNTEADLGEPAQRGHRPETEGGHRGADVEFQSRGLQGLNNDNASWRESREWRKLLKTTSPEYGSAFSGFLRGDQVGPEMRALQADLDSAGGFLVTPMQMVDQLIKTIDDMVFMRQWATVFSVAQAASLGVPTLESDPSDADWTTELATGNEDSDMSFGRRELHPHPLAKRLKISRKLLMKVPNVEALVMSRLAYKFAITAEKAFLLGTGSGQPLGVFVESADGIPSSRNISTGNTTTAVTFDGLIEAKYAIKMQYQPRLKMLGHRDLYKMIAKLKDGDGQYLWRESTRISEPDTVLGIPAYSSEYAPSTFTTGQFVGMFGDFSQYWVADSLQMEMQRLTELFSETNQIGIIGRMDMDGQPVSPGGEAFARITLA